MNSVEIIYSPALLEYYDTKGKSILVVDILRATTVICSMFLNGVQKVIPVKNLDEALNLKKQGYKVVAERNGEKLDFADFGNAPRYFQNGAVKGETLIYSTLNGTNAILAQHDGSEVLIGSFLNLSAVIAYLVQAKNDVIILCAGWNGKFNVEDSVYAGAVAAGLLSSGKFNSECDATLSSIQFWNNSEQDLISLMNSTYQKKRFDSLGIKNVIEYSVQIDIYKKVPVLINGCLTIATI